MFLLIKRCCNVTDYSGNNNNFTSGMTLTQDNPSNNFTTMKSQVIWHTYGVIELLLRNKL